MNLHAARLGISRGLIEFRQGLTDRENLTYTIVINAGFLAVLFFQRGSTVEGTTLSLAAVTLPSIIGMSIVFAGIPGIAMPLSAEREDGTLLRAKAAPYGTVSFLVGKLTLVTLSTLEGLLLVAIAAPFLPEVRAIGLGGLLGALGLLVLGLLATVPWGATLGSLFKTPGTAFGLSMLPFMGLAAISGIFYPIYGMPEWLQVVAQVFPVYWLGLGMRSAMLPDSAVMAEIGQSWRHVETLGVLGLWAIAGLLIAPAVLRRMARKESGSLMQARRQAAMQRVG